MLDLNEIRNNIDKIDSQLVELFEERMKLTTEVAEYKIETGKKVLDPAREKAKLESVKKLVKNPDNVHAIDDLFAQIMANSRKNQYMLLEKMGQTLREPYEAIDEINKKNCKVVYQGVPGAYSYAAMINFFGKDVDNFNVPTWIAETYVKIEHLLLGLPGTDLENVTAVYSHPQGLMQCDRFLDTHKDWQRISQANTALAAKMIFQEHNKTHVAIASKEAAELYGLDILKSGITDQEGNTTRFVIVTNTRKFVKNAQKMSIVFETANEAGTLYNLLSHIIYNGLNMNKIESRPIEGNVEGKRWNFRFFVDFAGNIDDPKVMNALRGIEEEAESIKLLGNY